MGEPVFNDKGDVTGMQGTMQDITDVIKINDELVRSLNEKEMMLKEIHHRVKNNLQVVSSLLRLQSEKITDKTAVEYFKLSEQRVKSMALIHQQLYKTRDLSRINFREYLRELCTYLFFVNGISAGRIQLKLESEDLFYGIDIALPCGLIINELITNSLKHAFPDGRKGAITVSLKKGNDGYNYLMVSDDGIGSKGIDPASTKTLGLELVNTLTEQIEGKIEMSSVNGTCTKISFRDQDTKKRT
jgi:two-component sensor histidine kinase